MVIDQFEYKKKYLRYWLQSECATYTHKDVNIYSTVNIVSTSFCIQTDQ
jgi:hypothetical protein